MKRLRDLRSKTRTAFHGRKRHRYLQYLQKLLGCLIIEWHEVRRARLEYFEDHKFETLFLVPEWVGGWKKLG